MDGEDDYSDHEYYNIFLGIPESVHEALRCLQERQTAIRNTSNGESTNFTNSSEAHRQKTIESVLKLFTDTIPGDTWINFQHAAANLHRMHSLVKKRLNRVFKTSYDQGYINFSTNFVQNVKRISQNSGYKRPLPLDSLRPLLTASSDPPLGTVRRQERRQLITVKRRPRAVTCSSPLQFNFKVLPNPISHGEVGQNVYNKPEMPSATAIQMQPPLPSQSDDFCNCSSCSSSSSSSSATSSEVDF
ncbi:unnamed protein product [Hymenolepis diminuta]|uniref:Uncharacterized protein n=1 Tax=Hymenolepis diminuta TaxID=6216 RepID=A0A0R3SVU1_HYMDI|nr:unnamed protein product [Hymenolepis diminuta]VUZ40765.1 unnamed protein product [Hymenolepis diminuta]